jgi:valyl-tRNA synthetase
VFGLLENSINRAKLKKNTCLNFVVLTASNLVPSIRPNEDTQMNEIPKTYDAKSAEAHWYAWWMEKGFFRSVPDEREPYTIVIPPPNVTGVLHMGHMLNNTIQDVLVRRARMQGKNACWVPGTDHASIATEAKVVKLLADQGIKKQNLTRDEFLKHAWSWKEKYGGIILEQLKKLGASCDWERTRFTMEDDLSEAVIEVFNKLYEKGYIYRGYRMVNWDSSALTAVSDEEVIMKEKNSKLFHLRYQIEGTDEWLTIATTRPETILGDTAVAVHPDDARYAHLHGKRVLVPLIKRSVPVIFDEYVDREFGTGALKVTPAHDKNDYELGKKHQLEMINMLNPDGILSKDAQLYIGQDRFAVRKQIVKDLEEAGHLVKTEDIKNSVGHSERTDAVIEPRLSQQWFVAMKEISKPALEHVENGDIRLIPDKFINTYRHWMENVQDWCISRQLWWGQRIPAWYLPEGDFVVAMNEADALKKAQQKNPAYTAADLRQDEDVVDTWFSSWLWPISVFDGFKDPNNKDIQYYYPTNDLVTAPEILFFWVARMIIAGYEYRGDLPFRNVYLTGIVRDKQGRKMSKSLGNSPDPLDLIDQYGADGVRVGMLFSSPAGNDLLFDESLCEQGRNFTNKIWNAFRLVKGWTADANAAQPPAAQNAIAWFEQRFQQQLAEIDEHYLRFRLSDALMATYKLVWDDFCSWYLEAVKPDFVDGQPKPVDAQTRAATTHFFEQILKLLHPFMPFISEELYHLFAKRSDQDALIVAPWPAQKAVDTALVDRFQIAVDVITQVRNIRKQKNIPPREQLTLLVKTTAPDKQFDALIAKLSGISTIDYVAEKPSGALGFVVKTSEYFVPFAANINVEEERVRLAKEIEYNKGFLKSVVSKLANERFVANAKPEIIANERSKQADAEAKIKALEEQLANL